MRIRVHDRELPEASFLPAGTVLPPHYAGTSRSVSLIATVRERLGRGVPLVDLVDVEAPHRDYEDLDNFGIDHPTAAAWFRFGFTPNEVLSWRDKRLRAAGTVAPLRDLGITPLDYASFLALTDAEARGRSSAQTLTKIARAWRAGAYGPEASLWDAIYWDETGYPVKEISRFRDDGIGYGTIFSMRTKFHVYSVAAVRYAIEHGQDSDFKPKLLRWLELGFTEKESIDFEAAGTDFEVARSVCARYSAAEILTASKAGVLDFFSTNWDLDTAIELHDLGVSPERADEIYDAGVTDVDLLLSVARGEVPLEWAASFSGAEVVEESPGATSFLTLAA